MTSESLLADLIHQYDILESLYKVAIKERDYQRTLTEQYKNKMDSLGNLLHQHIMNIEVYPPLGAGNRSSEDIAYKKGHRDARHSAAEIVLLILSEFKGREE